MKKTNIFIVTLFAILIYNTTLAQTTIYPDSNCDYATIPQHFTYNNLIYDTSYEGLKQMMNQIQNDDPKTYQMLLPQFNKLTKKRNQSLTIFCSSFVIGGIILGTGMSRLFKSDDDFLPTQKEINDFLHHGKSTIRNKSNDDSDTKNYVISFIGLGTIIIGALVSYNLAPERTDIFNLINTNNRNNKDSKIKWNLGYNPSTKTAEFALCYKF